MDRNEKFYMYKEAGKRNQLNDKHTAIQNRIFEAILRRERLFILPPPSLIFFSPNSLQWAFKHEAITTALGSVTVPYYIIQRSKEY